MARLRLFANLREIAGTGSIEIEGTTVAEVLAGASERFGDEFTRALSPAAVWVDGDRADQESAVGPASEVAVIPPVSGGTTVVRSPILMEIGLVAAFLAALVISSRMSLQWYAVAVVLVGGVWVFDVSTSSERRGIPLAHIPVLLSVGAAVAASYRFGVAGMAAAAVGSLLLVLVWSVAVAGLRPVDSFAAGGALAVAASLGSSAMVLLRMGSEDLTLVFLMVLSAGVMVAWLSDRTERPLVDPLAGLVVGAVLAGAIGGALWAPDLLDALGAAVAASIALVAGRNLGMLLRVGGLFAPGPVPGSLSYFDGALLAAMAFWSVLVVLA